MSLSAPCRNCGCRHFPIDNTVVRERIVIRYRRCRNCGQRRRTSERIIEENIEEVAPVVRAAGG